MILFTSCRDLERAENIKAVWDAYQGPKEFLKLSGLRNNVELKYPKYELLVTDEFVQCAPPKCIMIGHGIPMTKTYGLDDTMPYHKPKDGRLLTWVVAPSDYPFMIGAMAQQAGVDIERVIPLGMPRTDRYFGATKTRTGQKTYLYAPTYRRAHEGLDPMRSTDWYRIDELLTDKELMVVKAHMIGDDIDMSKYKHIVMASKDEPSTDYLINCDVVITDYSSIMFDALLLNKPNVLFTKDRGRYLSTRGMYFNFPENYSSKYCTTEDELVELIRTATLDDTDMRLKEACTNMCDGQSTERVIELIRKELGE